MNIRIISFAKRVEPAILQLEKEYLKRITRFADVEIVNFKPMSEGKINGVELKRFEKQFPKNAYWIALTENGKQISSQEFAAFLQARSQQGVGMICFILGGAEGLSKPLLDKAHFRLSLSRLTFPHQLARLLTIEALYRSFDLMHGGRYHKE